MIRENLNRFFRIMMKCKHPALFTKPDKRSLAFQFNEKTRSYGAIYRTKTGSELKKSNMNKLDVLHLIHDTEFDQEVNKYCEEMTNKEEEYSKLKMTLLSKLEEEHLTVEEKTNMRNVIDVLTQVPEYASSSTRIVVSNAQEGNYSRRRYLRVGNEYDKSQKIGVQMISRKTGPSGTETLYVRIGCHALIDIIKKNNIIVESLKKEEPRIIEE